MFFVIQKRTIAVAVFLLVFFGAYAAVLWSGANTAPAFQEQPAAREVTPVVVIDPGHGGADGGAVAADGTTESQINLAVALKLREILYLTGVDTAMTREEDISIHSDTAQTLREQKISDIHNRAEIVERVPGALLISIHQNSLPQVRSVHGAQVFYNTAQGSDLLARSIQEVLNSSINTERPKQEKRIDPSIYLMSHVACTGVLVECGFLSNDSETALLRQEDYQMKLAVLIAGGYLRYQSGAFQQAGESTQ